DHRLLVPRHVVREKVRRRDERLSDPRDVAVSEDAPHAGEEPLLDAVALDVLRGEEPEYCLGHGQPRHAETCRASTFSISATIGMQSAPAARGATSARAAP